MDENRILTLHYCQCIFFEKLTTVDFIMTLLGNSTQYIQFGKPWYCSGGSTSSKSIARLPDIGLNFAVRILKPEEDVI